MHINDSYFFFIGASFGAFIISFFKSYDKKIGFRLIIAFLSLSLLGALLSKLIFNILSGKSSYDLSGGYVFFGYFLPFFTLWLFSNPGVKSTFLNSIGISLTIAHSIGRVGCYFNNCCEGFLLGMPVQLIEATFLLILYFFMFSRSDRGNLFQVYIISYCTFRFGIEFFRTDIIRGIIFGFSTSQIIAIFLLLTTLLKQLFFEQKILERRAQT